MTAAVLNEVRSGFYLDSVALMRLSREIAALPGVEEAALMMGTPANMQIMADAGLLDEFGKAAEAGDLVLGIRAESPAAAAAARDRAVSLLDAPRRRGQSSGPAARRPRTLRAAAESQPGSNLALISVPGDFAAAEARKALRRGLHVMIFSDNVAMAEEVALKTEAREAGLLLMGPDCGTAIIDGVPLAFANKVPRGNIGLIGASGTGMQEISCLIARGGGGVSQAIGAGGRDLSEAVGGITTLMALDALDADSGTEHIVLVSKPPSAEVAARVMARIGASAKTFTVCFIGAGEFELPENAVLATTLKAAAEHALARAGTDAEIGAGFDTSGESLARREGRAVGLFAGGTLAAEAQVVFREAGAAVASNAPIPGVPGLGVSGLGAASAGHAMIDLGADEHTLNRPHPMIDPSVRDRALQDALADPSVAVLLLDLVLGFGAHGDPAGHLAQTLEGRPAGGPIIIASITGTEGDPQPRAAQVAKLEGAGVLVAPSNAQAAALACALCAGPG